jgi:hypothetical protein
MNQCTTVGECWNPEPDCDVLETCLRTGSMVLEDKETRRLFYYREGSVISEITPDDMVGGRFFVNSKVHYYRSPSVEPVLSPR